MKPKLYFDTSVFGGVYDKEFKQETKQLFDMVKKEEIICLYSELTMVELENAPEKVKDYFQKIINTNAEQIELTKESKRLATLYVTEKVSWPNKH